MNDKSLREITCGLGGTGNGIPRQSGYDITVASEIMAVFCLATDLDDLQKRVGNIVVGYTRNHDFLYNQQQYFQLFFANHLNQLLNKKQP